MIIIILKQATQMSTMGRKLRQAGGGAARWLLHAAAPLAVAACVLPQKQVPAPPTLEAPALHLQGLQVPPADLRWWSAFADPQLAALLERAQSDNPDLAQARARVRQAQAQVDMAHAGLLPAISAGASADRGRLPSHFVVPPPYAGHVGWIGAAGASLDWTVDLWGRQADALQAFSAEAQASRLQAEQAHLLIESAVVQAYIEDQRAVSLAALAVREVQARERLLTLARLRADAGLDSRLAQETAEAELPRARNAALQAQAAAALAEHALLALSGAGDTRLQAPKLDFDAVIPLPQTVPVNLLARRPDIVAARLQVEAGEARTREALAAYYPSVDLSALAGVASFGLSNLFRADAGAWSAGAAVSLPIFDAGRLHAGQSEAEARRDESVAAYNASVLRAVQQAADQISLIAALGQQRAQQGAVLRAADRSWQLATARTQAQLEDSRPQWNAELARIEAARADDNYAADLALARVRLLLAVGGSFDPAVPETRS
jgi:NodT family efflux transporter outer membrane factor (OMF) lipoprotein